MRKINEKELEEILAQSDDERVVEKAVEAFMKYIEEGGN